MDKVFALDIGTRRVRGLIADYVDNCFRILDCEILEHQTRAMYAGQIHDVEKVSEIVSQIKTVLEERNNLKLDRVAVAVAGRMLRTFREKIKKNIPPGEEITLEEVRSLELSAVQEIVNRLSKESMEFYCVGYSVTNYHLDGEKITNPISQKGEEIEVEILATFLPRKVLESIFTVLKKNNLQLSSVTLEPIAAINAVVQEDMRHLNLALVDVGAGTSDIAITRDGGIIAYGMVPSAGDEITEKLSECYLLDFTTAEKVKCSLLEKGKIKFSDIFSKEYELPFEEIMREILPAVEKLAEKIAQEIFILNKYSPQAIVCVGGGSRTPYLEEKLAVILSLRRERIGIRRTEMVRFLDDRTGKLRGPEGVTPVGIALLALQGKSLQFVNLLVNGKRVHLINLNKNLTVFSALVQAGVNLKKIYARPGLAKTFTVNNEIRIVKGTLGKNAVIKLNDQLVNLDTPVNENDEIIFMEAIDGEEAKVKIADLILEKEVREVLINGKEVRLYPQIFLDGEIMNDLEIEIPDRAKIMIRPDFSLRNILAREGYEINLIPMKETCVLVNGEMKVFKQKNYVLKINNEEKTFDEIVKDGNLIEYQVFPEISYRVKEVTNLPKDGENLKIKVNGEEYIFPGGKGKIFLNGKEGNAEDYVFDGAVIEIKMGKDAEIILADIFRYISLEVLTSEVITSDLESKELLTKENKYPLGKKLRLRVNNQEAKFTSPVVDGSEVKIYFE